MIDVLIIRAPTLVALALYYPHGNHTISPLNFTNHKNMSDVSECEHEFIL